VFINVFDPVSIGLVASLERPGRNLTGIFGFQTDIAATWVAMLHQIVPGVERIGVLHHPLTAAPIMPAHLRAAANAAGDHGLKFVRLPVESMTELAPVLSAFALQKAGSLIVMPSTFMATNRDAIVREINARRIPAMYGISPMVIAGGLMSYGPDIAAQWSAAAPYVERILNGAQPGELSVQAAPKTVLTINSRAANGLGLRIPNELQTRAEIVG
jgi:putative ABC transport system substrate-binding protein